MEIKINQKLCQGCEACIHACANGALYSQNGEIFIDQAKCDCCQACIRVCPTGAISLSEPAPVEVITSPRAIEVIQPEPKAISLPEQSRAAGGTLLSLIGQYVLPRAIDIFANYLERRLTSSVREQPAPTINSISTARCGRRVRRRARFNRFSSERR